MTSVSSTSGSTATAAATTPTTSANGTTTTTAANGTQTTTSPGSSILTSLGVGTGIDMTNLATEIATATFSNQVTNNSTQLSAVAVQISEASQLQSDFSSLVTSFSSLVNGGSLTATPSVTQSGVATASLPPGTNGAGLSYTLEVDQLAQGQVIASPGLSAATATTGSGTLSFQFGSTASGSFTADASKTPVTVAINRGDSLTQIAQDINSAGAGVTAYVAQTASGARLVMQGPTGADSAFSVTATENSADPGLSALNYTPGSVATGATTTTGTLLAQTPQDAQFSIDGIAQTSATNTVQNAAPSLSLSLTGTNTGQPTTITYSDPSANIGQSMTNLTSALNQITSELNTDMTASTNGSLTNDSGAQAFQRQMATLASTTIMPNAAAGAPSTLADLGLVVNKDGSFTFDSTKLHSALTSNAGAVAAMFTNGLYGVYGTLFNIQTSVTSTTDPGSLAGSVTTYTAQQTTLNTAKTNIANEQAALQAQLVNSLAAANTAVANSKSTMSFLTQQIAAWTNTSSSTSG